MRQLKVLSALAVQDIFNNELIAKFEQKSGSEVVTYYAPSAILLEDIAKGTEFDVFVGTTAAVRTLVEQNEIAKESVRDLARSNLGIAYQPGSPTPDISTPQSFIATMRSAQSITYSVRGASGGIFLEVLKKIGITEDLAETLTPIESGYTAENVAEGLTQFAVQQVSELRTVPSVAVASPFPAEFRAYVELQLGARPATGNARAQEFIEFVTSEQVSPVYDSYFLELVH